MDAISPLTENKHITLLKKIKTEQIILDWQSYFNIDITEEIMDKDEIYLYQCNKTKLMFFLPLDIAGSRKIYEKLEEIDWYYMPNKWEHDIAIQDFKNYSKVLEVGCGRGDFVERLRKESKIDAHGIELNPSAVDYAIRRGIPVSQTDLYKLAKEKEGYFDAVCSFQVLEHVAYPKSFLQALINLVKKNGKLIVSVPNSQSFIKYSQNNLLDQPPHHMTRWCEETFYHMNDIFPIKVHKILFEPLAEYHVDWYISIQLSRQLSRFSANRLFSSLSFHIFHKLLKPMLQQSPLIRGFIPGHTLYVCFEKMS